MARGDRRRCRGDPDGPRIPGGPALSADGAIDCRWCSSYFEGPNRRADYARHLREDHEDADAQLLGSNLGATKEPEIPAPQPAIVPPPTRRKIPTLPKTPKPSPEANGRELDRRIREIGDRAQRVLIAATRISIEGTRELEELLDLEDLGSAWPDGWVPPWHRPAEHTDSDMAVESAREVKPSDVLAPVAIFAVCDHPPAPGWTDCAWCWWAEVCRGGTPVLVAP